MNTTQCPRPGFQPGPLDPETSALTMRPPRLLLSREKKPKNRCRDIGLVWELQAPSDGLLVAIVALLTVVTNLTILTNLQL